MKDQLLLLVACTLLHLSPLAAQQPTPDQNRFVNEFIEGRINGTTATNVDFQNSAYHQGKFAPAVLFLINGKTSRSVMRYNAFADEMEFLKKGIVYEVVNKHVIDSIQLNDRTYVPMLITNLAGNPHYGFAFKKMGNDSVALYYQEPRTPEKARQFSQSYAEDRPPGYADAPIRYIVKYPGLGNVELARSKKRLQEQLLLFGDQTADWAKREKLKPKPADFEALVNYLAKY